MDAMDYSSDEESDISESDKNRLHNAFVEESRRLQNMSRDNVRRILDEQEKLNHELESEKKKLDSWRKELNKREAVIVELERQKLDEDKKKNDERNNSLQLASAEQEKADESVLRLVEEQKREKKDALDKILQLKKQLNAKQKVEMEIEVLRAKLEVMKHLGDQDERNNSLQLASAEQKKADESVLRLVEEHKREKKDALDKILQLEKQLNAKQKLEMEIEELKAKLEVMKHLGDQDDDAVQKKMKEMKQELDEKVDELEGLEDLNQTLSNDELQEARKELIQGLSEMLTARSHIAFILRNI